MVLTVFFYFYVLEFLVYSFFIGCQFTLNLSTFDQLDAVPYLIEHIHKNTARLLLHVNG